MTQYIDSKWIKHFRVSRDFFLIDYEAKAFDAKKDMRH
jgi:hypothetical protein